LGVVGGDISSSSANKKSFVTSFNKRITTATTPTVTVAAAAAAAAAVAEATTL